MNPVILMAVVLTAGTSEIARSIDIKGQIEWKPSLKPVLAAFIMGAFLLVIDEINTKIATAFAWLIMATAILTNGKPLLDYINKELR